MDKNQQRMSLIRKKLKKAKKRLLAKSPSGDELWYNPKNGEAELVAGILGNLGRVNFIEWIEENLKDYPGIDQNRVQILCDRLCTGEEFDENWEAIDGYDYEDYDE